MSLARDDRVWEDAAAFVRTVLCTRWSADAAEAARCQLQHVDWEMVLALASGEQVNPLLSRGLADQPAVPAAVMDHLRRAYLDTALENTLRLHESALMLRQLDSAGVRVMVLKGAALAEHVYGNIALRPMRDVDLLVQRPNAQRTISVAAQAGYRPLRAETVPGHALAFENEMLLRKDNRHEWALEVHWSLFDSSYHQNVLADALVWAEAIEVSFDDMTAWMLRPEAQFVHLAGHLMLHHQGRGLLWWADLGELLYHHGQGFDWGNVVRLATEWQLVGPVRDVVAQLSREWWGAVPADIVQQLQALRPAPGEQRVYASTQVARPPLLRLFDDIAGIEDQRSRLGFLWANVFPSAAYMDERYGIRHPLLRPLYYPYRWGLGVAEWLAARERKSQP